MGRYRNYILKKTTITNDSAELSFIKINDAVELYNMLEPFFKALRVVPVRPTYQRSSVGLELPTLEQVTSYARAQKIPICDAVDKIAYEVLRGDLRNSIVIKNDRHNHGCGGTKRQLGVWLSGKTWQLVERYRAEQPVSTFLRATVKAFFNNNQSTIINNQPKETSL